MDELKKVLIRHGEWGYVLSTRKQGISIPEGKAFPSIVDKVVSQLQQMGSAFEGWMIKGKGHFGVLSSSNGSFCAVIKF